MSQRLRYPAVPCNGCTRCCKGDAVLLLPGDDVSQYVTVAHEHFAGELMLAHKANGDCIYLDAKGCSIHERSPIMCKEMDCRNIAQAITFTQARQLNAQGKLKMAVWQRGKELLRLKKPLVSPQSPTGAPIAGPTVQRSPEPLEALLEAVP